MSWLFGLPRWELALLTLAAYAAWEGIKRWLESRKQAWPVVEGRIATTFVQSEMLDNFQHRTPEISYSYEVNGQRYSGVAEVFESDFDAYPAGSPILVHYKASNPSISRLDKSDMHEREKALDEREENESEEMDTSD